MQAPHAANPCRSGEYRRLQEKSRMLAVSWLCAHWLSQLALVGIVLVPLAMVIWFSTVRSSPELGPAHWEWRVGKAMLGSLACVFVLVCSVALRSHLAKRGGAVDWDK